MLVQMPDPRFRFPAERECPLTLSFEDRLARMHDPRDVPYDVAQEALFRCC